MGNGAMAHRPQATAPIHSTIRAWARAVPNAPRASPHVADRRRERLLQPLRTGRCRRFSVEEQAHYRACFSIVSEVGVPPVYDASRRDDADRGNSAIVRGLRIPGDARPASRRPRLRPSCGDELGTRQFGYEPLALGAPVLMRPVED